jgi:hypothetical protein
MNLSRPFPYIIATTPLADAMKVISQFRRELPDDVPELEKAQLVQRVVLDMLVCPNPLTFRL